MAVRIMDQVPLCFSIQRPLRSSFLRFKIDQTPVHQDPFAPAPPS